MWALVIEYLNCDVDAETRHVMGYMTAGRESCVVGMCFLIQVRDTPSIRVFGCLSADIVSHAVHLLEMIPAEGFPDGH